MSMYDFLKSLIAARNFRLSAMEQTIERHFCLGDLTKEQEIELLTLAAENADDRKEIDLAAVLADFELFPSKTVQNSCCSGRKIFAFRHFLSLDLVTRT